MTRVTPSDRERRHFAAIRRAKDAERSERLREALAKHPVERMREGLELGAYAVDAETIDSLDRRALNQQELARRGRALGMRANGDGRRGPA